jgi:isopenicillin-N N-acyltransferase-like protein
MLASPGGLGWIGLNDRGLGLVANDLLTPGRRIGLPSQVVRRLLLDTPNVGGALEILRRLPAVGGRAYVLGDAGGRVAAVEIAAEVDEAAVVESSTPIGHTNHALDDGVAALEATDLLASVYPSTWRRLARATSIVRTAPSRTVEDLRALLADHDGFPGSVCRHETPDEPTVTAASVVFDCGRRVAEFAIGNPCSNDFVAVAL